MELQGFRLCPLAFKYFQEDLRKQYTSDLKQQPKGLAWGFGVEVAAEVEVFFQEQSRIFVLGCRSRRIGLSLCDIVLWLLVHATDGLLFRNKGMLRFKT
jgi:hypothetical protein